MIKKLLIGLSLVMLASCADNTPIDLNLLDNNTSNIVAAADDENETLLEAANRKYNLIEIRGIGEVYVKKLNDVGLKNTEQFLQAAAKRTDRKKLADKTGISEKLILRWANHVDLMRVKGIGPKQSNWLEAVGVDSIPELAQRKADNLHQRLEIANNIDPTRKFVRNMVSQTTVQKWIDSAKATVPLVEVTH